MSNTDSTANTVETVELTKVPIFSAGVWEGNGSAKGGDSYTENDLDDMVSTYNEIGENVQPRLILGHDNDKSKDFSGLPSLGWIKNLYREGKVLYADMKDVPKKIKEAIDKKMYKRLSPGIWRNLNINGKIYKKVLDHVGLLGAKLPANTDLDLDGYIGLYEIENNEDLVMYFNIVENDMSDNAKLDELQAQLDAIQEELKAEKEAKQKLVDENNDLKVKFEKAEHDKKISEFEKYYDEQVSAGKVTPAQKEAFIALAMGNDGLTKYEYGDKIIEGDRIDLVKKVIEDNSSIPMGEGTKAVDKPEPDLKKKDDELETKALAYAKEKGVTINEAIDYVINNSRGGDE